MARPRGEIRQVLGCTVVRLVAERGPVNYRQVAAAAQVGFDAARVTLENMARAGEVRVAGKEKPAGAAHWHNLYEPVGGDDAVDVPQPWGGIEALAGAMKGWPGHG